MLRKLPKPKPTQTQGPGMYSKMRPEKIMRKVHLKLFGLLLVLQARMQLVCCGYFCHVLPLQHHSNMALFGMLRYKVFVEPRHTIKAPRTPTSIL